MNLRLFSIAVLVSALPLTLPASNEISFDHADFLSTDSVTDYGESVPKVKLSKSGKAKLKRLVKSVK